MKNYLVYMDIYLRIEIFDLVYMDIYLRIEIFDLVYHKHYMIN